MDQACLVIILAKAPLPGFAKTRLAPLLGNDGAAHLAAKMLAHTLDTALAAARGAVLLFLHADTGLPGQADCLIEAGLARSGKAWGRFDVRIVGTPVMLRVIAALMNLRSRLSGIATGDQAIFVRRDAFLAVGGFPDQLLMEDIEISRRLRRHSAPLCLRQRVCTSGRRWEVRGVWSTIWLMWRLRLRYWLGAPADRLAKEYR